MRESVCYWRDTYLHFMYVYTLLFRPVSQSFPIIHSRTSGVIQVASHFSAIFDKLDSPADQFSDVILVENLITHVLEKPWSEHQSKVW